ncbi:MAG: FAD-dependent oxidoreductase [Alphaproteobacteria bacterium]|nr:FAD-dependent oxidoreductase [Alphaproteobacteria bacterium]
MSCDVLVVGGGGAGLAAAIEARTHGAKVMLIEKNPELGGTTAWSIGSFSATQTPHQLSDGIVDTPDEHFEDMPKFSGDQADRDNPKLRRIFVDNANETLRWLMSMGVEFFGPMPEPPHRKPRMHNVLPNSRAYIHHLGKYAAKIGVEIRCNSRANKFLLDGDRVVGARCEMPLGITEVHAKTVVLASGDYAANHKLKAQYISPEVALVDAMNPNATGDGHEMAFPLGAKVLNGDVLSGPTLRFIAPPRETIDRMLPPWPVVTKFMRFALKYLPDRILRPFVLGFTTTSMAPELALFTNGALLVNKNGQRITDEPSKLGLAIASEPDKIGYVILDSELAAKYSAWPDFIATAPGVSYAYLDDFRKTRPDIFHKAETVMTLAGAMDMPPEEFKKSVEAHNATSETKLSSGPFYALGPAKSYIVLTDGGLAVDEDHRLLGENDTAIPGVFAAASAGQGGLMLKGHGHHIGWAFTSGRRAGRHAAKESGINVD